MTQPSKSRFLRAGAVASVVAIAAAWPSLAAAIETNSIVCGVLRSPGQYGPFDYRTIPLEPKTLVESAHFLPKVEAGIAGNASSVAGDIDYTLRAIPNHPRALLAMMRYATKVHSEQPDGARYPVECYFDRAIRMAPDDPMPHVLYAGYLKDRKRIAQAKAQLQEAESIRGDPGTFDLDYNMGLLYLDVGEPDKAAAAARRAYALGAPFPSLMNRLKAQGKWPASAVGPAAAATRSTRSAPAPAAEAAAPAEPLADPTTPAAPADAATTVPPPEAK